MKALNLITSKDSLRPQLQYIQLLDSFFNATDCHVLLKVPANEVMNEEILGQLPKEAYFSSNDWKNSKIEKSAYLKLNGSLIECLDRKFNTLGFLPFLTQEEFWSKAGKFPSFDQVIPNDENKEEILNISINPELLNNLYCANGKDTLQLTFFGKGRGAKIKFKDSSAIGLIMPVTFEK
jgi:hypothetical protein